MTFHETSNLSIDLHPNGIAHFWIDVKDRPMNVFSRQVLAEFDQALDRITAEPAVRLLVFLSRKENGFLAGADLHEFEKVRTSEEATALSALGQQLMDKVAGLRVPTVALIHGHCLGGGLEFALSCDYRVVNDGPGTQLGLPEIELGLLPGWGGTQRLPRTIGLERALLVILQRKRLDAKESLQWGLADAVVSSQDSAQTFIAEQLLAKARSEGKRVSRDTPLRTWRQKLLESTSLGRWLIFRGADSILKRKVPDDMPAPFEALQAIRVGLSQGMEAGLKQEREAIGRLAASSACRNLVTLFFLLEQAKKGGAAKDETVSTEGPKPAPERFRVGVVGAGTMGAGIAQLALLKGHEVVVREINEAALASGMKKIDNLFQKAVERNMLSREEAERKRATLRSTTSWEGFADVDLVIEAVIEDLDLKRKVFAELEKHTRPDAILATNTSSLTVKQIQEGLAHPGRVAGLHFFNPVHKMMLVEVVRGPATDAEVMRSLVRWSASLGKTPVAVGDGSGFIVNRILMPYLNEAGMLLSEGMSVERIDGTMRRFGMFMGPLEVLDQVGLDVAMHIARSVSPAFGERLKPHPSLEVMVAHGWLGEKSGKGFYVYKGKKKKVHVEALVLLASQFAGKSVGTNDARERMVCLMVNEAAACLGEGLADRADVIDLAMVLGTGWAPHRGGPLRYAADRGPVDVLRTLEALSRKHGPRFEPCAALRRHAESGEPFHQP